MKSAVIYEEAKRRFVEDGLSIDTIAKLLENEVTRRTLFNWKTENAWDEARASFINRELSLQDKLRDIAELAIQEARLNPTPTRIFAVSSAIAILKSLQFQELTPEKEAKAKTITKDTIDKVAELLGL
jgi:hypothetical protein